MLELSSISKKYNNREILKNISLQVEKGDTIAITGPSGSGKTTLLNIIGFLEKPDTGKIIFDSQEPEKFSEKEIAGFRNTQIGFVFQMHYLLPQLTVIENVLIPTLTIKSKETKKAKYTKALHLLERVCLANQINQRPGQLSGGECQRAAFVRALINSPKIILADEPTGSLDQQSADILSNLLIDLNRENNTTLIVVTHSVVLAGKMNKIFKLENGSLI